MCTNLHTVKITWTHLKQLLSTEIMNVGKIIDKLGYGKYPSIII